MRLQTDSVPPSRSAQTNVVVVDVKAQSAFVSAVVTSTKLVHSVPHEHETVGGCRDVTGLQQPEFIVRVAGALCDVEPDAKSDERSIVHAPVRLRVRASALRAAP